MAVYPQAVLTPEPLWLQTESYDAKSLRKPLSDMVTPGVESAGDYAVTINAGLQLSIAAGTAYILGQDVADQGMYRQYTTAAVLVTCNGHHATLPRIDQVILRIMDNTHDASGFNEPRIEIVPGTPTAGATLGNRNGAANLATLGENSKSVLLLADVLVPATSGAVTIGDKRVLAKVKLPLADLSVATGMLANLAVTEGKLAANAVTPAKAKLDAAETWNFLGILQSKSMRVHRHPYASDRHIENGNVTGAGSGAGVTFTDAFASTPTVTTSTTGSQDFHTAQSVSTTGFTLKTTNTGGGAGSDTGYWIAVGVD